MNSFTKHVRNVATVGISSAVVAGGLLTAVYAQTDEPTTDDATEQNVEFERSAKGKMGPRGMRFGGPEGPRGGMHQAPAEFQAIRQAVEDNDFDAWKAAVEAADENANTDALTQENFDKLVQAFQLHEQARVLQQEVFTQIHPGAATDTQTQ